jgi:hypothetical protein
MQWITKKTDDYETFYHITLKANVSSIQQQGIKQTIAGTNNDGVYCIHTDDPNGLDSVIQFMEMSDMSCKELVAIQFEYNGSYSEAKCVGLENGWCCITQSINPKNILDIIEL